MLSRKIDCQPASSVSAPPTTTPQPAPRPPMAPHRASARLRSRPGANEVAIRARVEAAANAAPAPCRPRPARSMAGSTASPQTADATVNTTMPARNVRRRPTTSPTRPASRRKPPNVRAYPDVTHARSASEKDSERWIEGSATFTIAKSMIRRNWLAQSTARRSRLAAGSWREEDTGRLSGQVGRRRGTQGDARPGCPGGRRPAGSGGRSGGAGGEGADVLGGERVARDAPVAALDLLDDAPGDGAHVLALDLDHGVRQALDHVPLLGGGEDAFDELDVDERHCLVPFDRRGEDHGIEGTARATPAHARDCRTARRPLPYSG